MKLNQFNGCKTVALTIILCAILLIFYHNLFKTYFIQYKRLNGTDIPATAEENAENRITTAKRIKRFLIFQGGGVVKLVFGTAFPIKMADNKRSLNYFYNFQMQYAPPTIPLYWWSIYNTSTFAARKQSIEKLMRFDTARDFIYEFIKTTLTRAGNSGSECLLNGICKLARAPFLEDFNTPQQNLWDGDGIELEDDSGRNIYHKILNIIFTPFHSNVKEQYLDARKAGENGANCDRTYGKCPIIEDWLRKYTRFA